MTLPRIFRDIPNAYSFHALFYDALIPESPYSCAHHYFAYIYSCAHLYYAYI